MFQVGTHSLPLETRNYCYKLLLYGQRWENSSQTQKWWERAGLKWGTWWQNHHQVGYLPIGLLWKGGIFTEIKHSEEKNTERKREDKKYLLLTTCPPTIVLWSFVESLEQLNEDRTKEDVMSTKVHKEVDVGLERLRRLGSVPGITLTNNSQNWIFFTSFNIFFWHLLERHQSLLCTRFLWDEMTSHLLEAELLMWPVVEML